MSDQLSLVSAIEDCGIARDKAERIASVIFGAIRETVTTGTDLAQVPQDLAATLGKIQADIEALRVGMLQLEARMNARIELRMVARGGLMAVIGGAALAALHLWPLCA